MAEHMPPTPAALSRQGHRPFFDPLGAWEPMEGPGPARATASTDDQPAQLNLETPATDWKPVDLPEHPPLQYFPSLVLAGAEKGLVLCHANDPAGRPIPVWLARLAAGSLTLHADGTTDKTGPMVRETVLALCADSMPEDWLEESIHTLTGEGVRLLTALWPAGPDGEREPTFRPGPLLDQAQKRARDELVPLLGEALQRSAPQGRVAWLDGRLRFQHVRGLGPDNGSADDLHLVGIEREPCREFLHPAGARCRLDLKAGQRTPAFLLPGPRGMRDLVSWFLRLWPPVVHDPEGGLIRVEVTRGWWEQNGSSGANATSAWMAHLRGQSQSAEGPGWLAPIATLHDLLDSQLNDLETIAKRLKSLWHLA
ncbi:MAG: hypothetical protein LW700_09945 [Gemmataceae bacterium]|jgi:hypothetical protein|nr:hypothetical protein [Gemmataceae bacterium]